MSQNIGHIIYTTLRPATSNDVFPVTLSNENKGGLHSYTTINDLNTIPLERRMEGMEVYLASGGTKYILSGGTSNNQWVLVPKTFKNAGTGSTLYGGVDNNGVGLIKNIIAGPGLMIVDNGTNLMLNVTAVPSLNIVNDPYNYTTWSVDNISGATRQVLANKFQAIDTSISSLTGNTSNLNTIILSGDVIGSGTTAISATVNWSNGYPTYDQRYLQKVDFDNYSANTLTIFNGFTATTLNINDFDIYSASTLNNINSKVSIFDFNSYSGNTLNNINSRLLITDFNDYTGNTTNKQTILSGDVIGSGTTAISTTVNWINGYSTYDNRYLQINNFNSYSANTYNSITSNTALTNTKLNITDFNSYSGNTLTDVNNRLLISDFNSYSASTNNSITSNTALINTKLNITDFNSYSANTLSFMGSNYLPLSGGSMSGITTFTGTGSTIQLPFLQILDSNGITYRTALSAGAATQQLTLGGTSVGYTRINTPGSLFMYDGGTGTYKQTIVGTTNTMTFAQGWSVLNIQSITSYTAAIVGNSTESISFIKGSISPNSGSGIGSGLAWTTTVNQTGIATGVVAGIYLNPTVTSVSTGGTLTGIYSNINTFSAGTTYNIYAPGTAPNYFAGNTTFAGNLVSKGITDGSSASVGNVGEILNNIVSGYTNYTATATYQNVTSITLTAGDWDIFAFGTFNSNTATITAASNVVFALSKSSAATDSFSIEGSTISYIPQSALIGTSKESTGSIKTNVSISVTTTYYLITQSTFTVGNPQFVGSISARRMR